MSAELTCREIVEFLGAYRTGSLPPETQAGFVAHLAECPACLDYLAAYESTIALTRASLQAPDDLPPGMPEELVQTIVRSRLLGSA